MLISEANILVCDDSILARKQLKDALKEYGVVNIREAVNGQEAIDQYKSEKANLVFIDIVMPVKDGISAIEEICQFDNKAQIIVVSSVGTQSQLKAAIEKGASDFIQKPLNKHQIEEILISRFERG